MPKVWDMFVSFVCGNSGTGISWGHRKDVRVYLDPPEQPPDPLDLSEEMAADLGILEDILPRAVWTI